MSSCVKKCENVDTYLTVKWGEYYQKLVNSALDSNKALKTEFTELKEDIEESVEVVDSFTTTVQNLQQTDATLQSSIVTLQGKTTVVFANGNFIGANRVGDVIYNVLDGSSKSVTYKKEMTLPDGSAVTDALLDGYSYIKVGSEYFTKVFPGGIINIEDFGGKGDYTHSTTTGTDNTIPLRKAIAYAVSRKKPSQYTIPTNRASTIYVPQGNWLITDEIAIPGGIIIRGSGRNSTLFVADMKNTNGTRPSGNKSLFVTQDLSEPYDNNEFYNFAIQGTNSDAWLIGDRHYTLKNGIELRNGYQKLSDLNIVGSEDYGVYADVMIGSVFERVLVDYSGKAGLWLSGIATPSTTTDFISCTFRGTRRGPGVVLSGKIISTSFHNCLFELNGIENNSLGYGVRINGNPSLAENVPYDLNVGFYGCDWESNQTTKVWAQKAHVYLDENCRYTNNVATEDFYFDDCGVSFTNMSYRGSSDIVFRIKNTTRSSSRLNIVAPNISINDFEFLNSGGTVPAEGYKYPRLMRLNCVGSDGTTNINYFGYRGTIEAGYINSDNTGNTLTGELTLPNYGTGSVVSGTDIALLGVTSTGKVIPLGSKIITATQQLDFPNIPTGTTADLTMTVTGAALGDAVSLGIPSNQVVLGAMYFAAVSAANTVTIRVFNPTGADINPGNGTYRIKIVK